MNRTRPPKGHGARHDHFKLVALDVPHLTDPAPAGVEAIWKKACEDEPEKTELVGISEIY